MKLRNPASTQDLYLKALGLSQEMADAYPDNLGGLWALAAARERLGDFYLRTKRPELAGKQYEVAVRLFQDLVNRDPKRASYNDDLSRVLYSTALAAQRRGETALAADKYRAALAIREARTRRQMDLVALRDLMVTLARCGEYGRAAEMAGRVRKQSGTDLGSLIDVACCFAICSDVVAASKPAGELTPEQSRLREHYAGQALEALQAAVARGYRDVVNLETEPDLDAVRERPNFKALLDALNHPPAK
jgi:tetratricopeptide (TPR) repeat protein